MTEFRFIGLSGYARAGKDTIANVLADYGYQRVAFADKLKEATRRLNPILGIDSMSLGMRFLRVQDIEAKYTPDKIKELYPEYRELLQRMGTEVGRNLFGEDFWVDIAFSGLDVNSKYVFTDARFPNEFEGIKAHAGQMWRVNRPGYGPANQHPSEISLDNYKRFDVVFNNSGTQEDLVALVNRHMNEVSA